MSDTAWCQPNYEGKIHPRKFMVVYEDAEMGSAIFDDEAEAREHFEKASVAWNCYLFGLMPRSAFPAPRGGLEPNWWEEWVKTTRAYNALAKAAQAVIDEAKAIHDDDPWPLLYRAPYEAITKLSAVLEASDKSAAVSPPPAEILVGSRTAELEAALKLAIEHIEHMAAWITKLKSGYSFESLGEDMPGLKAALASTSEGSTDAA